MFLACSTYNNQYMVLNVGSFKPASALLEDTLWVVEQIPGEAASWSSRDSLRIEYDEGHWSRGTTPKSVPEDAGRHGHIIRSR